MDKRQVVSLKEVYSKLPKCMTTLLHRCLKAYNTYPPRCTYSDSEMRITLATLIPNSNWNLAWSRSVPPECVCNLLHLSSAQVIVYVSERCRGQVKGAGPVDPMLDVRWVFPFLPSRPNWPPGISQSLVSVIRTEVGAMTRATDETRDESTREEGRGDTAKTPKTTEWCGLSGKGACCHTRCMTVFGVGQSSFIKEEPDSIQKCFFL